MKASIKRKWIEALEGGQYKQTTGTLSAKDSSGNKMYCCLGVLWQVCGDGFHDDSDGDYDSFQPIGNSSIEVLDDDNLLRFGMTDEVQRMLAKLNDSGHDFKQIAEYIHCLTVEED